MPMNILRLEDWSEFDNVLRSELKAMGHKGLVAVRNFQLVTFTPDGTEFDRLTHARSYGTDRDVDSELWDVEGFDHPHDKHPTGKRADEIIYAFTIDLSTTPYQVHHGSVPETLNLVEQLTEHDGVLVYDSHKLDRRSMNEYWFKTAPLDAALMIFTLHT